MGKFPTKTRVIFRRIYLEVNGYVHQIDQDVRDFPCYLSIIALA